MKIKLILLLCSLGLIIPIFSQDLSAEKVPGIVMNAFKSKYPDVKKVEWEMEDSKYYEAEFKLNHQEQSVIFDEQGIWIKTEIEIKISELPTAIQQSLSTQYSGFKAEDANKIEDPINGIYYKFEIEKGKEEFEIMFKENGTLMSKTADDENEDDD